MLRLQAFRIEQKEVGSASLAPGMTEPLSPIYEFGAKPYTEDEERSLSEIIQAFNDRHGTAFTPEDFLRFEQVNREITDEDMTAMLRTNPPDVVYSAFRDAFFRGTIRTFQHCGRCGRTRRNSAGKRPALQSGGRSSQTVSARGVNSHEQ